MRHIFPLHGKSLLFGLILLCALGAVLSRKPLPPQKTVLDLAVQHTGALILDIDMTTKTGSSLISLTAKAKEPILISVPDTWQKTQVRNTTLAEVAEKERSLGFVQWHIPANATVTFKALNPPDQFHILNPNQQPMQVQYKRVNLSTGEVIDTSVLLSTHPVTL